MDRRADADGSCEAGFRPIEPGVRRDLAGTMTYAGYLDLDRLLNAQHPRSEHHDELLFVIQHQVTELWLKLLIHELRSTIDLLGEDKLQPALKRLASGSSTSSGRCSNSGRCSRR